jgi:Family of unknown function (DUF5683)
MQQQTNNVFLKKYLLLTGILLCNIIAISQKNTPVKIADDTIRVQPPKLNRYDSAMQAHSPRVAAIRSAILPGLGQIYNRKYWKLPIVYGGLGISAGVFAYNMKWYKKTRFAYKVLYLKDTASYSKVDPKLQFLVNGNALDNLRYYRNQYRRDIDYSVIAFLLLWGLNVVDATVDAHLMSFDISPDLSLKIKPGHSEMAHTNGLSVILKIGK